MDRHRQRQRRLQRNPGVRRTIGSCADLTETKPMPARQARIGVIGAGWWSTYTHIPGLVENPHARLAAICDRSEAACERATTAFPGPAAYVDVEAMLTDVELDGVVIAVPHAAHHLVAARCLDAGLNVMLEKPMVLTAMHAADLVQRAETQGVELIIGYPWHFTRTAIRAREILASGELGVIQHVVCAQSSMVVEFYRGNDAAYQPVFEWTVAGPGDVYARPEVSGGGQGHLQITHSSGLMFFVTGLRPQRVSALMRSFDVPVDLVDVMTVEFEGGALGVVSGTGNVPVGDAGQLDVRVYCEHGYILLDAITGSLEVRRRDGSIERDQLPADDTYPRFTTAANLVNVCLGLEANGSPATFGHRSVEMLEAAYRSAEANGRMVEVRDLYD